MVNGISKSQRTVGITNIKVAKVTSAMPSPPQAGDDTPRLNSGMYDPGTCDVDRYEVEDGDDADVDEEEEVL
jgi:hypothetical protein